MFRNHDGKHFAEEFLESLKMSEYFGSVRDIYMETELINRDLSEQWTN